MAEIILISLIGAGCATFALHRAWHHTCHIEVIRHNAPLPPAGGAGGGHVRDSAKP